MSKGTIVSHLGDGRYTVRLALSRARVDRRIAQIDAGLPNLSAAIPQAQTEAETALGALLAAQAEVDAAIAELIAATGSSVIKDANGEVDVQTGAKEAIAAVKAAAEAMAPKQAEYDNKVRKLTELQLKKSSLEKEKAYLQSHMTDAPVVEAWCADLTESLAGDVATIEIRGERPEIPQLIRPGYQGRAAYDPTRDGLLQPSAASGPEAVFWNWALEPGWAKWKPTYRIGKITAINGDRCTVLLDASTNSAANAHEGRTFELNAPGTYNPQTHAMEYPAGVSVVGGQTQLADVPIEYMECNGGAFEVDDRVVVQFIDRDWTRPKVIGFENNPKPCEQHGIVCYVDHTAHSPEHVRLVRGSAGTYSMKRGDPNWVGGNITWFDAKGNVLSWLGPFGRNCPPRLLQDLPFNYWVYNIDVSNYTNLKLVRPGATPAAWATRMLRRFSGEIWRNGKLYAMAPTHWVVLGAAITTGGGVDYLVAVVTRSEFGIVGSYSSVYQQDNPEILYDRVLYVKTADLPAVPTGTNVPWVEAAQETYAAYPGVLPRIGCYAFNRSGTQAASLIQLDGYPDDRELRNDLISRITIAGTPGGLSATFSLQPQSGTQIVDTIVQTGNTDQVPEGTTEYDMLTWNTSATFSGSVSGAASAVVAIDYDGDTEIVATATFAYTQGGGGSSHNSGANGAFLSYAESVTKIQSWSLTLALGAAPVVLLDQSYSDDWNYANNGDSGGVSRTETALTGIDRLHFAYLDIRNGAAVTWIEGATATENRTYAATYSGGSWSNTGSYVLTSNLAYEIDIGQTAAYAGADAPGKNQSSAGTGVDFRVGGEVPPSTTTSVRNVSIPNLFRQDLIPNFAGEAGDYVFDLPTMRIAGDKSGAVAASMYARRYLPACYSLETSASYTPIITAPEKAVDLVGFSGGNIDAIYAAYQIVQYPPVVGDPGHPNNTTDTALQSGMTAKFTV